MRLPPQKNCWSSMWCNATRNGHWPRCVSFPPMTKPVEYETFPQGAVKRLSDSSSSSKVSSTPHSSVTTLKTVLISSSPRKSRSMHWFLLSHKFFNLLRYVKACPFKLWMLLLSKPKIEIENQLRLTSGTQTNDLSSYTTKFLQASP